MPEEQEQLQPPQTQEHRPGIESEVTPRPVADDPNYKAAGKLQNRVALVLGGDSGIGRAIAVAFAKEGADVAVAYLNEDSDAEETKRLVEEHGGKCVLIPGDLGQEQNCIEAVQKTVEQLGKLNILVNNAAEQHPQKSLQDITQEQLERTFRTNIFAYFFLAKAALPHLKEGSAIINTASVTAFKGAPELLDYSSTKGAIIGFTRSLSQNVVEQGIRVNAIASGPIWTPLIPSTFPAEEVASFGSDVPMKRAGQPEEVANCYVFLASDDSSYITGQTLHPNGGTVVNG